MSDVQLRIKALQSVQTDLEMERDSCGATTPILTNATTHAHRASTRSESKNARKLSRPPIAAAASLLIFALVVQQFGELHTGRLSRSAVRST